MPFTSGVLPGLADICLRITSLMKAPQQQPQPQPEQCHGGAMHHHGRDKQQQHSEQQQQPLVPWQRVCLMQLAATVIDMANSCVNVWLKDILSLHGPLLHALAGSAVAMMQEAKAAAATGQLPYQPAEPHGISAAAAARAGGAVLSAAADSVNRAQTSLAAAAASTKFLLSKNVLHLLVVHLAAMVPRLQEKQHGGTAAASAVKSSSSTTSSTSSSSSSASISNQHSIAPSPHQQLLAAAGLQARHVTCQWQGTNPRLLLQVCAVNNTVVIRAALQHILERLPESGQHCRAHGKIIVGFLPLELLQALLLVLAELASLCQSTGPLHQLTGVLSCVLQTMGICRKLLAASSTIARLSGAQRMDDSTADKVGLHNFCRHQMEARMHSCTE
jgi:hypothetical protein